MNVCKLRVLNFRHDDQNSSSLKLNHLGITQDDDNRENWNIFLCLGTNWSCQVKRLYLYLILSMTENENKEKGKNIVCFFSFGILSLIYDEICLIAAEDILAGSTIATTTVILSIAIPVLAIKLAAPWFFQRISYLKKILLVMAFLLGGLTALVTSQRISGRLAGVGIIESGVATSEIAFLSLTAFYEHITVSAFVAGVGVASFIGPLYYTSKYEWVSASYMWFLRIWPTMWWATTLEPGIFPHDFRASRENTWGLGREASTFPSTVGNDRFTDFPGRREKSFTKIFLLFQRGSEIFAQSGLSVPCEQSLFLRYRCFVPSNKI